MARLMPICQAQRVVLAEQFTSREHDAFLFAEVERDLISERTREGTSPRRRQSSGTVCAFNQSSSKGRGWLETTVFAKGVQV
jgi:hypothetical protein